MFLGKDVFPVVIELFLEFDQLRFSEDWCRGGIFLQGLLILSNDTIPFGFFFLDRYSQPIDDGLNLPEFFLMVSDQLPLLLDFILIVLLLLLGAATSLPLHLCVIEHKIFMHLDEL